LAYVISILREKDGKDMLHIVLERGHKNAPDCERIFHEFKQLWKEQGADFFGTFTLQDKQSCMPLMVADMLAATYSMRRAREASGDLSLAAYDMEKPKKGGLVFIELAPNALRQLKEGYEAARLRKMAAWLASRGAKRAQNHLPSPGV
jgi:hypothetical protein